MKLFITFINKYMEEKKGGCGCGSRKVIMKQPIASSKSLVKPVNKIYKTKTSIFN